MTDKQSVLLVRTSHPRTLILKPPQNVCDLSLVLEKTTSIDQKPSSNHSQGTNAISSPFGCSARFQPFNTIDWNEFTPLLARPVFGSLGVIQLENDVFLCVVTDCVKVLEIERHPIFRIAQVRFFSVLKSTYDNLPNPNDPYDVSYPSESDSNIIHPCAPLQKLLCNGSFYFSPSYNLTESTQKRFFNSTLSKKPPSTSKKLDSPSSFEHSTEALKHLDFHFVWNQHMLDPITIVRDQQLDSSQREKIDASGLFIVAISGFIGSEKFRFRGQHFRMAILSRLSCKRTGARFLARGVDDQGNVSNFVETEFLILGPTFTFSFLQIRGSIPMFWEQSGIQMTHKIEITRGPEATAPAVRKHFEEMLDRYSKVHIVNLLKQDSMSSEFPLSEEYREHVNALKDLKELLPFTRFDFHAIVGRDSYDRLNILVNQIQGALEDYNYFLYDHDSESIIMMQQGVFRTNCLDCLDRTNVVQSTISKSAIQQLLSGMGIDMYAEGLLQGFNSLWADNGDWLSKIYAGTGALKSSFTRKGKTTVLGFLDDVSKSVNRFVINNFQDKSRQEAIDTLLGKVSVRYRIPIENPLHSAVMKLLDTRSPEFTTFDRIHCFVGTFNVNGKLPSCNFSSWLKTDTCPAPEIYVIGLQELIELTAGQIVSADTVRFRTTWEQALLMNLNKISSYEYVAFRSINLVAMTLFIFVRIDHVQSVKHVEVSMKKTGLGGMAGNKGGIGVSLSFWDTTMVFVTAHLAAGQSNIEERNENYWTITNGLNFRGKSILDHDFCFWFGDFNYRIDLPNEYIRGSLDRKEKKFDYLYKHDQLNEQMLRGLAFDAFKEHEINFPPTYKFDVGSKLYDTSEKMRSPAWTDRILHRGLNMVSLEYNSAEDIIISDHRPVRSVFIVQTKLIDHQVKANIQSEIYRNIGGSFQLQMPVTAPPKPHALSRAGTEPLRAAHPIHSVAQVQSRMNSLLIQDQVSSRLGNAISDMRSSPGYGITAPEKPQRSHPQQQTGVLIDILDAVLVKNNEETIRTSPGSTSSFSSPDSKFSSSPNKTTKPPVPTAPKPSLHSGNAFSYTNKNGDGSNFDSAQSIPTQLSQTPSQPVPPKPKTAVSNTSNFNLMNNSVDNTINRQAPPPLPERPTSSSTSSVSKPFLASTDRSNTVGPSLPERRKAPPAPPPSKPARQQSTPLINSPHNPFVFNNNGSTTDSANMNNSNGQITNSMKAINSGTLLSKENGSRLTDFNTSLISFSQDNLFSGNNSNNNTGMVRQHVVDPLIKSDPWAIKTSNTTGTSSTSHLTNKPMNSSPILLSKDSSSVSSNAMNSTQGQTNSVSASFKVQDMINKFQN